MTNEKKKSITILVTEYTLERIENIMRKKQIPQNEKSQFIEEQIILKALNKKHTQDYMIHWGYLNQPQKCLKCYKELEAGTYAAEQGGVIICQDCHSKRWTTPAIERRRAVKLELENDIKCLTMDIIAVGVQLDEAKKELGYAEELRSLRDIYITRQKEFDDTIEAKQQLLKNLELQINECKLEVAWNKLESVLPEVIKASENAEEEAKCWASIKELRNVVIKLVTDILNSQHSARPDLKYALHTIS